MFYPSLGQKWILWMLFLAVHFLCTNQMSIRDVYSQSLFTPRAADMPRLPKRRRITAGAGAPMRRRRRFGSYRDYGDSSVRGFRIPRGIAGSTFMTPATNILNATQTAIVPGKSTFIAAWTTTGTSSNNGWFFDPSGVYSNAGAGGSTAMPGWANYAALYDEYKIRNITVTMRYTPSDQVEDVVEIWYQPNPDTAMTGTISQLQNKNNVFHHRFCPEYPTISCAFKPKVFQELYNSGILSAQARQSQLMPYCDTDVPAQVYGFTWSAYTPAGAVTNSSIVFDISYDVLFKTRGA